MNTVEIMNSEGLKSFGEGRLTVRAVTDLGQVSAMLWPVTRHRVKMPARGARAAIVTGPGMRVVPVSPGGEVEIEVEGVKELSSPFMVEVVSGSGPKSFGEGRLRVSRVSNPGEVSGMVG